MDFNGKLIISPQWGLIEVASVNWPRSAVILTVYH